MEFSDVARILWYVIVSMTSLGSVVGFFANWWGNRLAEKISNEEKARHAQDLERLKTQLDLTKSMVVRYSEQQFAVYSQLWASLYDLKVLGDDLWELANRKKHQLFVKQLRVTRDTVERSALFVEDEHYQRLQELISEFRLYEVGKDDLIRMRENEGFNIDNEWDQRVANREHWVEYTRLIPDIKNAFRRQIHVQSK